MNAGKQGDRLPLMIQPVPLLPLWSAKRSNLKEDAQ
jgi:hypothetical protein